MTAVAHASLAAEIARVAKLGNLTAAHLAEGTGGDPSSARRWLRGTRAPSAVHAVRALELTSLVERLAQVMQAADIPIWLIKPIERLDDRRPIDVIRPATTAACCGSSRPSRACPSRRCCPSTSTQATSTASSCVTSPDGGDPLYEPVRAS